MKNSCKVVSSVLVLIMMFTVIVQSGCSLFDKTARLQSMVDAGKYEEAIDYYRENRGDISKDDAVTLFETAIDKMYQDYLVGNVESSDIQGFINDLEKVKSDDLNAYCNAIWSDVLEIEDSREAYSKAEEAFNNGKFDEAISYYQLVIEEDANFADAQSKIADCKESYKEKKLGEAEQFADNEDYLSAINCLNDASAIVGDDSDIDNLLSVYQTAFDAYIFDAATALAETGNYDEAIELLSDNLSYVSDITTCKEAIANYTDIAVQEYLSAENFSSLVSENNYEAAFDVLDAVQKDYPDSELLKTTIDETEDSFVSYEVAIIDAFIEVSDYESAYEQAKQALTVLPNSSELKEKKDYAEDRLPVSMMGSYNSTTSDGYNNSYYLLSDKTEMEDLFGNDYGGGDGFCIYFGAYQQTVGVDFYLNEEFSKFTATTVICKEQLTDNETLDLYIYGDDELIYQKAITNQTTPDDLLDIDVSGVTWLKIEFVKDGGTVFSDVYVAVANPILYYK